MKVITWYKARKFVVRTNTGILGSNPSRGMDVRLPSFWFFIALCR